MKANLIIIEIYFLIGNCFGQFGKKIGYFALGAGAHRYTDKIPDIDSSMYALWIVTA